MGIGTYLFGGDATKGMASGPAHGRNIANWLTASADQPAPMMDVSQANQSRAQQNQLAQMLFGQATGATPGAGEMAVNRQVGQAQAGQTALASMARGAGAGLAGRNAARMSADLGVNGAGMAQQAQMADQSAAQGQLNALLGNMRGQDINVAGANQAAQLAQQQQGLQAMAQLLGVDVATLQQDLAKRGIQMQDKGMMGQLLQIGGQIGAAYAGAPRGGGTGGTGGTGA